MRSRDDVRSILKALLDDVTLDEAQVSYDSEQRTSTRFADNAITQNSSGASEQVTIEVAIGRSEGSTTTNRLDPDHLRDALRRAEEVARNAPANPEFVPLPGPQEYPAVPQRYFDGTAAVPPEQLADDVSTVIRGGMPHGLAASGHFQLLAQTAAVANTNGLFGYDRSTVVGYSATMHGTAGSGKFSVNENDHTRLDVARLTDRIVDNTKAAQNPVEIDPGDYTVIFEPLAVSELLAFLPYTMSARDADEGSTVFAGAVGTRMVSPRVTIRTRIDDSRLPAPPFGSAGLASRPVTWFEQGVLQRLHHDRYWAQEKGTAPDALRFPVFMDGESGTVDDLVARCERGLLVKNLWYIRFVDRKQLMLTGMTRDGLFLVENGRIVGPVKNLRWNESPVQFLNNVTGLSQPERVGTRPWGILPGVMSEGFTFTSTTDSV